MKFSTFALSSALWIATASTNLHMSHSFSVHPTNVVVHPKNNHSISSSGISSSGSSSSFSPLYSTAATDATVTAESYEFQAEVERVMDIIINSLYSDKDIFLRELVSNAADACDKKRFLSVVSDSSEKGSDTTPPQIKIRADVDNQTIIIEDTGVGMTKDELINNLGRIAQSGTKNFMQALGEGKADVNLIGQFGVGFYSAYLVADKVEVITKSMQAGSPQLRWESDSGSKFTISDASDAEPIVGSGTRLILHMKDDAMQYLESSKLEELLQRYSEFIEFPISIYKEETTYEKVPDEEANKNLKEGETPKMKTIPVTKADYTLMNSQKPIWLRPVKDVTDDEYKQFYKSAFRASYDEPQKWSHFRMEGQVECKALLYIPGMLPFELSKDMFDEDARNIRLYVKRVFINDKFEDIMPRWLKFIKGVVDSDDLPLNVSREILQKSKVLSIINKRLVRKSIDMFKDIAADEDPSKYIMFWNNFGKYLKVGVIDDEKNKEELVPLLRFYSSKSGEEYTSFDRYVEGMPEGQKSIYYVTGEGRKNAMLQPVIEKFASRGYEVLLMTEPLDEITIENIRKYKDFNVVDATKEGLDLEEDEESKKEKEKLNEKYAQVREYLEVELEGKVQKVTVSKLLTNSPAALVQGAYGVSPTMQRYMKAQSVASGGSGNFSSMNQAVLEINPNHPIVIDLDKMIRKDKDDAETKNFAMLIYDLASLTSGYEIADTGEFAKRVMAMMTSKAKDDVAKDDATAESATEEGEKSNDDDDKAVNPEVIV